jgi:hypothetical protein
MPNVEELLPLLTSMPRREYADLIRRVDTQRRQAAEREAQKYRPRNEMSKDEFVDWIAAQHFAIDKGLSRILYFPSGAPAEEVRLLEVNVLARLPENAPVEALDFLLDIEGVDFTLFVADVTPRQFDAVMKGELALPKGWQMDGYREIPIGSS